VREKSQEKKGSKAAKNEKNEINSTPSFFFSLSSFLESLDS
jgi:hypothetical protein